MCYMINEDAPVIVQKFGGTSVATLERIKSVACIIANTKSKGKSIVAVVSAMAGVTNKFVSYVRNMGGIDSCAESDFVVSSGELVSAGLLAIALKDHGINAAPYAGWQVPIITNEEYGSATILDVQTDNITAALSRGIIPIVCGFQGITQSHRVTTLGRGGSDLTAVAIASAIGAQLCEIYSDVDGIYTVDPNIYGKANKITEINYMEMLEMSSYGAKVLQEQSVDYAMGKKVKIRVASSFIDSEGSFISDAVSVKQFVGIAVSRDLAQIKAYCRDITRVDEVLQLLSKNFISVEMFKDGVDNKIKIMLDKQKISKALSILSKVDILSGVKQVIMKKHFARISIIGRNFSKTVADTLENQLVSDGIKVFDTSVFEHRVNIIISSENMHFAVDVLHKYCGL